MEQNLLDAYKKLWATGMYEKHLYYLYQYVDISLQLIFIWKRNLNSSLVHLKRACFDISSLKCQKGFLLLQNFIKTM